VTIILLLVKKLYFKKQLRNVKGSNIKAATFIVMPKGVGYGSPMKPKSKKKKKGGKK